MTKLDEVIVAARHADVDAAERWFRLLCDPDTADVVAGLRDHDPSATEALEHTMTSIADPDATLCAVRDLGADAALARYYELLGADPQAAATAEEEDVTTWQAFLAEKGPFWDGAEENWQAFRDWFAYEAHRTGVPGLAAAFLEYAESTGDKVAVFVAYGIPLTADAPASAPAPDLAEHITAAFAADLPALGSLSDAEIDELARRAAKTLLADQD